MIDVWDNKQQKKCFNNDKLNSTINNLCDSITKMENIWDNEQQRRDSMDGNLNNKIKALCTELTEIICRKEEEKKPQKKKFSNEYICFYSSNPYKTHKF